MAISFNGQKRIRRTFGRIPRSPPMPNLIEVQRTSYEHFLQMGDRPKSAPMSVCKKSSSRFPDS